MRVLSKTWVVSCRYEDHERLIDFVAASGYKFFDVFKKDYDLKRFWNYSFSNGYLLLCYTVLNDYGNLRCVHRKFRDVYCIINNELTYIDAELKFTSVDEFIKYHLNMENL